MDIKCNNHDNSVDFLLIYEHQIREIDGLCLIKMELENRGYSVEVVHARDVYPVRKFKSKKAKVYVVQALYSNLEIEEGIFKFTPYAPKVVNMQWEQVLSNRDLKIGFHTPKGKAKDAVHICWGEDSYNRLIRAGVKHPVVTGAIQMDFFKNALVNVYKSRKELDKKYGFPNKKMILFVSSFGYATLPYGAVEATAKKVGDYIWDFRDLSIASRREILTWFEKFLDENEDYFIVYRPHPSETVDKEITSFLDNHKDFYVINDDSVSQWIISADIVLTWFSSSIAEAYFAGKDCYVLRPIPISEIDEIIMYEGTDFIDSYEGLHNVITDVREYNFVKGTNIERVYGKKDDSFTYLRICDLLEKVYCDESYDVNYRATVLQRFSLSIKNIIRSLIFSLDIDENSFLIKRMNRARAYVKLVREIDKQLETTYSTQREINEKVGLFRQLLSS